MDRPLDFNYAQLGRRKLWIRHQRSNVSALAKYRRYLLVTANGWPLLTSCKDQGDERASAVAKFFKKIIKIQRNQPPPTIAI